MLGVQEAEAKALATCDEEHQGDGVMRWKDVASCFTHGIGKLCVFLHFFHLLNVTFWCMSGFGYCS